MTTTTYSNYLFIIYFCVCLFTRNVVSDGIVGFNFPDFKNSSGSLSVSQGVVFLDDGALQLATTAGGTAGNYFAWYSSQVVVRGFDTTFSFTVTNNASHDGFAFVVQLGSTISGGTAGYSGLGYGDLGNNTNTRGIPQSIAIEVDMSTNPELGDPDDHHVSVHTRGTEHNNAHEYYSRASASSFPRFAQDGKAHTMRLVYDPIAFGGVLSVYMDDNAGASLTVSGLNFQSLIGIDDTTGSAWVGFTAANISLNINSWKFTATGVPNASNTIVSGLDYQPYAGEIATFYIQPVDQFNYNVTANLAEFDITLTEADGSTATLAANYAGNGVYKVQYNITSSGDASFTIIMNGDKLIRSPYDIAVVPGPVEPRQCVAWGEGITKDKVAGYIGQFYIQLYDSFSNNVTHGVNISTLQATLISEDTGDVVDVADIVYVSDGLYIANYNLTIVGGYVINITLNDVGIKNSVHRISVAPGPLVEANSIAQQISTLTTAGITNILSIQLRDAFGNNITQPTNNNNTITLVLQHHVFPITLNGSVDYVGKGEYYVYYNLTVSGTYTLNAYVNDQYVLDGRVEIEVQPTYLVPLNSIATGSAATSGVAGEISTFLVQLRDAFSNNITNNGSAVVAAVIQTTPQLNCNVQYVDNGIYSVSYNITLAKQYPITVTINNRPITQPSPTITVIPAATYAPNSEAYYDATAGIAGEVHVFKIQLRDYFENNITTAQNVKITVSITSPTTAPQEAQVTFDAPTGLYLATYNLTKTESYSLLVTIDDGNIRNPQSTLVVSPAAFSAYTSLAFGELEVKADAGEIHTLYLQIRDIYTNNITKISDPTVYSVVAEFNSSTKNEEFTLSYQNEGVYALTYNITFAETYILSLEINDTPIINPQHQVLIIPTLVYPPYCYPEGPGLNSSTAGLQGNFSIHLYDIFGNKIFLPQTNQSYVPIAIVTNQDNGIKTNLPITHNVTSGDYVVEYNLTVSGNYLLQVTINDEVVTDGTHALLVAPSSLAVWRSTAAGSGVVSGVAGIAESFTIQLRDVFNNPITYYDEVTSDPVVRITSAKEQVTATVTKANNGVYKVSYVTDHADIFTTAITINGQHILGSPFTTKIANAKYDLGHTLPIAVNKEITAGHPTTFWLQFRDQYDNNVTSEVVPAEQLVFKLAPTTLNAREPEYNVSITFNDDVGVYEIDYVVITSGKYEVIVNVTESVLGGLPIQVFCAPDETYPEFCEVANSGSDWNKAVVKTTNYFSLVAKDQYHNRRLIGGDDVDVQLTADGVSPVNGVVKDNNDGTYAISYFLHDKAQYTLNITINGTAVGNPNAPLKVDAQYANNPVPTFLIVACVLGGGVVLAVAGFFIYRRYNRLKYEILE